MPERKRKFDACLLRINADEFLVAEWHQLVTTVDKAKLTIGSCVGYRRSTNKREKVIRGAIVIMGSLKVCEQQMKMFTAKMNKKKVPTKTFDDKDETEEESDDVPDDETEEEPDDVPADKASLDSNDEQSSGSNDGYLYIHTEEENCDDIHSKTIQAEELTIVQQGNKNQTNKSDITPLNVEHIEEQKTCSSSSKRTNSDAMMECSASKRSMCSVARCNELIVENIRLKNQVEKYKNEWMSRPTDPGVIRYFVRMREIFSSNGENDEGKGDKLAVVCDRLGMNEEQLNQLQKVNGTKTARSIVRAYYPPGVRMNVTLEDIDANFRQAVHDYVQMYHGMEGLTEGKINESINNVFRSAKSQQRKDLKQQSPHLPTNSSITINGNKTSDVRNKENVASSN